MRPGTVSIRFCGGCNPRIDRGRVALELKVALEERGHRVVWGGREADFRIFLSGCLSGCAFKYNPADPPCVVVAGTTVDDEEVGEAQVVSDVLKKVDQSGMRPRP